MRSFPRFGILNLAASSALVLCSCDPATVGAMKWNASQRAELSSISVPTASLDSGGYFTPAAGSSTQAPIVQTGGGFGQGAAVNAGIALIFEVASGIEQKNFENKYGASVQGVAGNVPGDLDRRISRALSAQIGRHGFFRGKVTDHSANRLKVKVTRYGLMRSASTGGETMMTPAIYGTWELTLASGKTIARQPFAAASASRQGTVTEFAGNRALAHKAFDEAAEAVANVIVADINRRLGDHADHTTRTFAPRVEKNAAPAQLPNIAPAELNRNSRYTFKLGYNRFISQPNTLFVIGGHELKIAATGNGGVLYVMKPTSALGGTRISLDSGEYRALRAALAGEGVGISGQAHVTGLGMKIGFILELDGNGWNVIQKFRK